jgi:hypothetical protein
MSEVEQARRGAHVRLTVRYVEGMKRARRIDAIAFTPADGKAMYRLMDQVGEERAGRIIDYVCGDPWLCTRRSIRDMASDPGKYEVGTVSSPDTDRRQRSAIDATVRGRVAVNGRDDL